MKLFVFFIFFILSQNIFANKSIEEMRLKGGSQFTKCYFCHSLKPNVHMTGPSLANLWNAKAGSIKTFNIYTESLKKSGLIWNEETLIKWLTKPSELVHGTNMTYKFEGDETNLRQLIEFLKVALKPNGYEVALKNKYIPKEYADGQIPKSWKPIDKENIIEKLEICDSLIIVYRKNKIKTKHWVENISLRLADLSQKELISKEIQIRPMGSFGDRFVVIFPNLESMKNQVGPCIQKPSTDLFD